MIPCSLQVAIDIGSESVKVAFTYTFPNEDIECGKLIQDETDLFPFPSLAYYDEKNENWIFGENIYLKANNSFKTIVKIKELLDLLVPMSKAQKGESKYYFTEKYFPMFYFPKKKTKDKNYQDLINSKMTFEAKQKVVEVCEMFFKNLFKEAIEPSIGKLIKARKYDIKCIDYVVVYPAFANQEYIDELKRLVEKCGVKVLCVVSAPKAIGLYAFHEGVLGDERKAVVVNIGESNMSVAKIATYNAVVRVDGADAHSLPVELGGEAYDEILRQLIEYKISKREILGATNSDNEKLSEYGTHYQQFLLSSNIKNAKTILSIDDGEFKTLFKKGAPLNAERDVTVEVMITREEFLEGIKENNEIVVSGCNIGRDAVSPKIADYILNELRRKNNADVNKLILSGGASEAYGLKEYISEVIKKEFNGKISIVDFDKIPISKKYKDQFVINKNEDMVYAAAVGASIFAVQKYTFETVSSLSYGTWCYPYETVVSSQTKTKILSILLYKDTKIDKNGQKFETSFTTQGPTEEIRGDEFFSTISKVSIPVYEPNSYARSEIIKKYDLKVISGKKNKGTIFFRKNGRPFKVSAGFKFIEGIKIDADGRAKPYVSNADNREKYRDIEVILEGLDDFDLYDM